MSEIAKALANAAKITESGHLQRAHQKSAEAVRKNHNREFIWGGLIACVVLVALGAFFVHSEQPSPPVTVVTQSAPATETAQTPPPVERIGPKHPNPVLESELANLVIKGLIKSPNLRVLIGDRVIQVGDELTPGLVLSGIDGRDLLATDAQGVTYLKKL